MKSLLFIACCLVLICTHAPAQKIYYDKGNTVTTPENGYYYVIKTKEFSDGDTLREYYCSTNSLKSISVVNSSGYTDGMFTTYYENGAIRVKGQCEKYRPVGKFTQWYANGQMKLEQVFSGSDEPDRIVNYWDSLGTQLVKDGEGRCDCILDIVGFSEIRELGNINNGLRDSVWIGYEKSGRHYFTERYKQGKLIDGVSYDSLGKQYAYKEIEENAKPVNGMEFFYMNIGRNIKYPSQARRKGIEGKVFVQFLVEKDGTLTNVETIKGIGGGCDEAAEEVIRLSPPWTPGRQRGMVVRQKMVLPINFKLG